MAVSLSGIAAVGSNLNDDAPIPRPTESQEVHQLELSGLNNQQIAMAIPLPLSDVDLTLGDTSSTDTSASALVALSSRLSVSA
jgi:hypothetical protein